ncbi:MAG TPA: cytochrome c oxidase subunit 3 [Terracidiphilus sp.]|nr:cytochrome c oxidase subunit 3 [Terracidiphilus sp.]
MSSLVQIPPPSAKLAVLPIDQSRGLWGVWWTIATEAMLFMCMFGAYYYLGNNKDRWATEKPPHLVYPFILLAILVSSSIILHWGEKQVLKNHFRSGRIALWISIVFGLVFLTLQAFEYASEWKDITPDSDSYGSIFYTITSLHAAHVIVGVLLMMYVGFLPHYGLMRRSPHRPYQVVARYWHFVDAVWVFIVLLLYCVPHWLRH